MIINFKLSHFKSNKSYQLKQINTIKYEISGVYQLKTEDDDQNIGHDIQIIFVNI